MPSVGFTSGRLNIAVAVLALLATPVGAAMPPRSGVMPPELIQAFERGLFDRPTPPYLGTSTVGMRWRIPVVLVDFPDQPFTFGSAAEWEFALFDSTGSTPTGSIYDYYRWVSGNRLSVTGRVVATVRLDQSKTYYAGNSWGLGSSTPQNSYGAVDEALRKCSTSIDWSEFDQDLDGYVDVVWVLHAGLGGEHVVSRQELWSISSRLTDWSGGNVFRTNDFVPGTSNYELINAFTIVPELSGFRPGARSEIGVHCHEFGHAIGLPDLYGVSPVSGLFNAGPGNWSLMSTGAYGGNGSSPEFPSHLGAWPASYLGWTRVERPAEDGPMSLGSIEGGAPVLELWFQGEASSEHFLIENRQRQEFDRNLPAEGIVVYQVDDLAIRARIPSNQVNTGYYPALRLVEGDGGSELMTGQSRGDASDPLPGTGAVLRWDDDTRPNTRSILGNPTHVALNGIRAVGDSMSFRVQVRPRGWLPPQDRSGPSYVPVVESGPGARATMLPDSGVVAVSCEFVAGRPQIVLRERRADHTWAPPVQVSDTPAAASDPSVAALPGGDLSVVWSDSRHGANELYYRFRFRGSWSPEYRLTELVGHSRSPAVAADRFGGVHVAWLYSGPTGVHVNFMYFTYLSPFGDALQITPLGSRPDAPAVAVAPDGSSYLLWIDRSPVFGSVQYAHFAPDSGIRPARVLTPNQSGTVSTVNGAVDAGGTLHFVWQVSGAAGAEVRYGSRGATTSSDTTIVRRGESIQNLGVAVTADSAIHVVLEALRGGVAQILYKEWRPDGGWDVGATEVTRTSDGVATLPSVLPRRAGTVTVLYTAYPAGADAAFMERDRNIWLQALTAVAAYSPPPSWGSWSAFPNPIRAGQSLWFRGAGGPQILDVFDIEGRRVATAESRLQLGGWSAEIGGDLTRNWKSGIYFARVRGGSERARIVVLR